MYGSVKIYLVGKNKKRFFPTLFPPLIIDFLPLFFNDRIKKNKKEKTETTEMILDRNLHPVFFPINIPGIYFAISILAPPHPTPTSSYT